MTPERYHELCAIFARDGFVEFDDDREAQEFTELAPAQLDALVIASTTRTASRGESVTTAPATYAHLGRIKPLRFPLSTIHFLGRTAMTTLTINDLPRNENLGRNAMAAVCGGRKLPWQNIALGNLIPVDPIYPGDPIFPTDPIYVLPRHRSQPRWSRAPAGLQSGTSCRNPQL